MNEKLFSAKGVCKNKNEYFELHKQNKCFKDRKIRPILIACGIISLAMCVYDIIIKEDILALMSAGFAFLFLYPTLFSHIFDAQKQYDEDKNRILNVGLYCDFYDNRFTVTKKEKEKAVSYSKIAAVRKTKSKYYLFSKDDMTYYVNRDLFEIGDSNEFYDFIKEKIKKGK